MPSDDSDQSTGFETRKDIDERVPSDDRSVCWIRDLSREMMSSDMCAQRRLRSACKIRDFSRPMISSHVFNDDRLACKIRDFSLDMTSSNTWAQRRLRSACNFGALSNDIISSDRFAQYTSTSESVSSDDKDQSSRLENGAAIYLRTCMPSNDSDQSARIETGAAK